jgi:hypothetical protein
VLETAEEIEGLQALLDASYASGGQHLRSIIDEERRIDAVNLVRLLTGMRLLVTGTISGDGRPLTAPVDGYLLHGVWHFSVGRHSLRARHLARRPAISVTHLPGEELAVTVHGVAEPYDLKDPGRPELRQAMLDHYVPLQGPAFAEWLEQVDAVAVQVRPLRMFTFHIP